MKTPFNDYLLEAQKTQPRPSLEAQNDNLEELEYIFYGKLTNFDQFTKADRAETQEQWSVFLTNGHGGDGKVENNLRVRSVNDSQYYLTAKLYLPGAAGKWELEREVNQDHFEVMKAIATDGMRKERYYFPVEGHEDLTWEVDVHYDDDGNRIHWVRVELEVPEKLSSIPPLPLQFEETIMRQRKHQTDEEQAFVKQLYGRYILKGAAVAKEDADGDSGDNTVVEPPSGEEEVTEENGVTIKTDDEIKNGGVTNALEPKVPEETGPEDGDDNTEDDTDTSDDDDDTDKDDDSKDEDTDADDDSDDDEKKD